MYSGHELDYIYFVHSIHILGRLLCFVKGQQFFPIKVKDRDGMLDLLQCSLFKVILVKIFIWVTMILRKPNQL